MSLDASKYAKAIQDFFRQWLVVVGIGSCAAAPWMAGLDSPASESALFTHTTSVSSSSLLPGNKTPALPNDYQGSFGSTSAVASYTSDSPSPLHGLDSPASDVSFAELEEAHARLTDELEKAKALLEYFRKTQSRLFEQYHAHIQPESFIPFTEFQERNPNYQMWLQHVGVVTQMFKQAREAVLDAAQTPRQWTKLCKVIHPNQKASLPDRFFGSPARVGAELDMDDIIAAAWASSLNT